MKKAARLSPITLLLIESQASLSWLITMTLYNKFTADEKDLYKIKADMINLDLVQRFEKTINLYIREYKRHT